MLHALTNDEHFRKAPSIFARPRAFSQRALGLKYRILIPLFPRYHYLILSVLKVSFPFALSNQKRALPASLTSPSAKNGLELDRGCFHGSLAEFRAQVRKTHANNTKIEKHYLGLCNLIALWFDLPAEIES